ncbi:MAG: glycerate kinase [Clostridia bacterium]|nr:glycerate kinase [Clostridia bacterium]
MNILVAPDSFKGSLDSERICRIVRYAAKRAFADCRITELPLADGGEGTASLMAKALRGAVEKVTVEGPFGKPVKAEIAFVDKGNTAIIESAQAFGLPLAGKRANPERTSSFGVGQMISFATSRGAKKIVLTLGGSSTNDLGAGMLSAMGVQFVDICGNHFTPVGGNLSRVESIEYNQAFSKYRETEFILLCDVNNPLLGENGCAAVFSPQKGASPDAVKRLERGAEKLASIFCKVTGTDEREAPGAGAAGGIGFAAMSFLRAKVKSGTDTVLRMYDFDRHVSNADLIITGEGKLDAQSFMGKTVGGVIERCRGKECVIVCGINEAEWLPEAVRVICISDEVGSEYAMNNAAECLQKAMDRFFSEYKQ